MQVANYPHIHIIGPTIEYRATHSVLTEKHNVINHIIMLKHHRKYCLVLDLKYIVVLILLEILSNISRCIDSIIVGPNICQVSVNVHGTYLTRAIINCEFTVRVSNSLPVVHVTFTEEHTFLVRGRFVHH